MSASIDLNGVVTLTGDGFGRNRGRKQLVAAPSTAVKMQLVSRLYFTDAPASSNRYSAQAWDSASYFGLGFSDVWYDFSGGDAVTFADLFGVATTRKPFLSTGGTYNNNDKIIHAHDWGAGMSLALGAPWYQGSPSTYRQYAGILNGIGGLHAESYIAATDAAVYQPLLFARNATDGAKLTYMWEVSGSLADNSVFSRFVVDNTSLAEGDAMFTAMDGKTTGSAAWNILQYTIHGNTTSAWRNAGSPGTMNFPRWLKFQCALPQYSWVLKYWKIRYLDASNTVVYEQAP